MSTQKDVHRISNLCGTEALVALGLQAVVTTIALSGIDINTCLRITLASIECAMFDVALQSHQAVTQTLKVLPRERAKWQALRSRCYRRCRGDIVRRECDGWETRGQGRRRHDRILSES